ncbi:histidine ammonia-lyase domain protein [Dictyocaulus viviparus]|uniref:Histidine ammonia-lyase domain protein n=1 Tax=Dictyocaulus viviparus TaxID=29172 RepID=A0A0D8XIX2_DICVI|nr:histidine ammonia-lyase domain protein [Dictyocaulus viviparus]
MNSATDNPLVFVDREEIISGGNFHGEYPAKALDYLAIAVHELAQISERRLERLVNNQLSGLPTFLTPNGGLNSGLMTVQLCAASLVSENKVLCHPSSVDSIPTSCNQEDHVSMGGFSARKALTVVEHVEAGAEFLSDIILKELLNFYRSSYGTKKAQNLNKQFLKCLYMPQIEAMFFRPLTEDRFMQPDIEAVIQLLRENKVWECVEKHLKTMSEMEDLDPDALRIDAKTPTGIVVSQRVDLPFDSDTAKNYWFIESTTCTKVWECVEKHLKTMSEMEDLDPDALRIDAKTPTGIVVSQRVDLPFDSDTVSSEDMAIK